MIWYDDLFIGEGITPRKKKRIIRMTEKRSIFNGAWLLALSSGPDGLIDIIPARELKQRGYPQRDMLVIGLARDRDDAMELAGEIIGSFYKARGDFRLKEFFMDGAARNGGGAC